jgi:hypothetical protein
MSSTAIASALARDRGQPAVEPGRQISLDLPHFPRNDVEVVEQPFGARFDELA